MWPWNASTRGEIYLFHFTAPLGNLSNPRAQASHYLGFAEDLDARLAKQLAGRGAKIVAAALKQGLVFEIYHWPACLASEKLIKKTKKTALYCPACCAAAGRKVKALPTPPALEQLTLELDEPLPDLPISTKLDWLEMTIQQRWRAARIPAPFGLDDDLL